MAMKKLVLPDVESNSYDLGERGILSIGWGSPSFLQPVIVEVEATVLLLFPDVSPPPPHPLVDVVVSLRKLFNMMRNNGASMIGYFVPMMIVAV